MRALLCGQRQRTKDAILGLASASAKSIHAFRAVALEPTVVSYIASEKLAKLTRDNSMIASELLALLCREDEEMRFSGRGWLGCKEPDSR
jgi:hypothetical protein